MPRSTFVGKVKGSRGEASRLGGRTSGMDLLGAGTQGSVHVKLSHQGDIEIATVTLEPWKGHGKHALVFEGPLSGTVSLSAAKRTLVRRILAEQFHVSEDMVSDVTDEIMRALYAG